MAMQSKGAAHAISHPVNVSGLDAQEFQTLYQEKVGSIYRYVFSKVGNRELAEDLTSEIFLTAIKGFNREFGPQSIQQWLYLIARSTIADYWRAHYRAPTSSLDELLETGWAGPVEEEPFELNGMSVQRVQSLLQALPGRYREILVCRFLMNLSIKDTALRMGVTEANVKVLQFRALKRAADIESVVIVQQHSAL